MWIGRDDYCGVGGWNAAGSGWFKVGWTSLDGWTGWVVDGGVWSWSGWWKSVTEQPDQSVMTCCNSPHLRSEWSSDNLSHSSSPACCSSATSRCSVAFAGTN